MPTTPKYALRYPAPTDPADVPADMGNLALDVEGVLAGAKLPGAQVGYAQITAPAVAVGTSFATGANIVTCATVALDGATPVWVEFYAPAVVNNVVAQTVFSLNDGGTQRGFMGAHVQSVAGASPCAVYTKTRFTPPAGVRSIAALAWVSAGQATVTAGTGVGAAFVPAWIRVSIA